MRAFFTSKISGRLYGLLFLFLVGITGIVAFQLSHLRTELDGFKRTELQSVVDGGAHIAQFYYDRAVAGEFTQQEAQRRAKETLRHMRYQHGGYLSIDSFGYQNIMDAATPKKEGTDRTNEKDGNGKLYLKEMIDHAKADGSAYESYAWQDESSGKFLDKVTYAQAFKPWGWVISSGVLMNDVQAIFLDSAVSSGLIAFAIMAGLILLGVFIVRGITKPLGKLNASMLELANSNYDNEPGGTKRTDEIGAMARAVEVFRQNGLKVTQLTEEEARTLARNQAERAQMMGELQLAFGNVVDAAVAGDFSRRVDTEFPDAELNSLAASINNLVETVDRGITATGEVLSALAAADLTMRVEGDFGGSLGQLRDNTNLVADKLADVVTRMRSTSRSLKTATGEILSGANDLSERTTKQAATIEETSAAMEQLATTVLENAKRAQEASAIANTVTDTAETSGKVMHEANSAMDRITDSSNKISNIIGLIDDIAFQTNLLALNASVEAARAGDAGKGFAVVAVEVRRLAQSAAGASSEVKTLIEQSGMEVTQGSKLVSEAAGRLEAMLNAARQNNQLMDGIARDSRVQASGIEEINVAVRQMDEMTQHNAALVEETNAAIEQTEAQAVELDRIVDVFTLEKTGEASDARSQAAQPNGIKGLQAKVKRAANYLTNGNAALEPGWNEF